MSKAFEFLTSRLSDFDHFDTIGSKHADELCPECNKNLRKAYHRPDLNRPEKLSVVTWCTECNVVVDAFDADGKAVIFFKI